MFDPATGSITKTGQDDSLARPPRDRDVVPDASVIFAGEDREKLGATQRSVVSE